MVNSCFGITIGFAVIVYIVSADPDVSNGTNAMTGLPEVSCTQDGVAFTMETERPFQGQLYVKDEYFNPKCRVNFKDVSKPGASFHLTFSECGMRRQRIMNPRGMLYSVMMMVQFHDIFVTQGDHAYQIRCFYTEQQMNVTNSLDVSPLTTVVMEATFPSPTCSYSIRTKTGDGTAATVVKVGDPIIHVFSCNFALEMYRILIKDCFVDDGKAQQQLIIGPDGCSVDETIMQTPQYRSDKLEAFGESTAFKWPDESVVYFSCQIILCMNEGNACDDVTPPKCTEKSRTRRSNKPLKNQLEFDLEVKKLIVVENDAIRSRPTPRHRAVDIHVENATYNNSLYDDYVSINGANTTTALGAQTSQDSSTLATALRSKIISQMDEFYQRNRACFGFETVIVFFVLFTLFVASLTMVACKLCLPCCSVGDRSSGRAEMNGNGSSNSNFNTVSSSDSFRGMCFVRKSANADDLDFEDCYRSFQQPIYMPAPLTVSATYLLQREFGNVI